MLENGVTWLALLVFNVPVVVLLWRLGVVTDVRRLVQEKSLFGTEGAPSFSRVTGLAGAGILAALFWAVGELAIYKGFTDPAAVGPTIRAFWPLFLVGAALFIPYMLNQAKGAASVAGMGAAVAKASAPVGVAAAPATPTITLMVINVTNAISDDEFNRAVAAISVQVNEHFMPVWGVSANLVPSRFALNGLKVNIHGVAHAIVYVGESTSDPNMSDPTLGVSGTYGYHSQTHGELPYAFVFRDVCGKFKEAWTCTLSHEILELLVDPNTLATVNGPAPAEAGGPGQVVRYGLEVCDPTQGDHYEIDGVSVSNFVTKAYFGLTAAATATNHMGLPLEPFGVRPKGYIQYEDLTGMRQLNGGKVDEARIAARKILDTHRRNARRELRFKGEG